MGLGAPPNLASELEEALIEEVQKNPGLTRGVHIEDLASGGEGGSNLTPGEVGGLGVDVEIEVVDEITWESDEDEDQDQDEDQYHDQEEHEHETGENEKEYIAEDSDSGESSDSGYDGKLAGRNDDTVMDTGLGYDEGYEEEEEEDWYRGIGTAGGRADWNDMSNDIDVDPYAGRATKSQGADDVKMGLGEADGNGDAVWDGVEALEPGEDEAVDGYEGTGEGAERNVGDDVWW